ncbi:jmjC domain-containing protein 8 isoform X3 [Pleurodeles waltl]|uniref:jmjC domain-containing protein 8 isoform X3 n=1 Tax=Pleurodeles waltl TaxID=8319 RepID=UPI003709BDA0
MWQRLSAQIITRTLLLALMPLAILCHVDYLEVDGGWYAFSRPVILQGITNNLGFQALCTKEMLLKEFGDRMVRLSTANTYSYEKVDVMFREYVEHLLRPQDKDSLGCDTLYFFGDNNFTEWGSLFQKYSPPPFRIPGTTGAYSFGVAGSGTGVPFHWHGPGFSEVIFGRKRWFLYPPDKTPEFNPNKTTLSWLTDNYPLLPEHERPVECTIRPGEDKVDSKGHKAALLLKLQKHNKLKQAFSCSCLAE